ncbi:MAG: Dolichol monophosphate mannose synthase, partial [Candidatus Curtissbacteria bacterium GW2011_GWA1_41_11]
MISIVVPTFNEKENIHELLSRISLSLGGKNIPYEVVVIDDYSTDGTWELLQQEQGNFPLKIYRKLGKKGKAYSLIEGFSQASGDVLAMIDADLQYPPEAIGQMAEALGDCDIVIANRSKYKTPAA